MVNTSRYIRYKAREWGFGIRRSNAVLNRAFGPAGMPNVNVNAPFGSGERRSNALAERNRPISITEEYGYGNF
jgi:hypothetical protein